MLPFRVGPTLAVAELALGAARTERNDLRWLVEAVTTQVRSPGFLISRQPDLAALGALRHGSNARVRSRVPVEETVGKRSRRSARRPALHRTA